MHTDRTSIGKDDEVILLPVKYPQTSEQLLSVALSVRNIKLNRGLIALNVVYDDKQRISNQDKGKQLLEHLQKLSGASDVLLQTQVRISTNIANGIKHAFKEFNASEIIMGMPSKTDISNKFWGEFANSLTNGLPRQIMFSTITQPLNTMRKIHVAVPSRAEFEPGFLRWTERLARLSKNSDCKIHLHARHTTLQLIRQYITNNHQIRAEYSQMEHWNELPNLLTTINTDHLLIIIAARKGTISYKTAMEKLPNEIKRFYQGSNLMIVYPDQNAQDDNEMTFADPQQHAGTSAYTAISDWIAKQKRKL